MQVALVLLVVAQVAEASPLERARALRDDFKLDEALAVVEAGLAKEVDKSAIMGLLELEAEVQLARNDREAAKGAYIELLTRVPAYATPRYLSPKAREVLDEARAIVHATHPEVPLVSPAETSLMTSTAPPARSVTSRPWFWVAVAGGAAIITTSVVLLVSRGDGAPTGDYGPYIVR